MAEKANGNYKKYKHYTSKGAINRGVASGGVWGGVTPPTFGIFVGKFNSVEFRRYMADVLRQAVFKCVGNGVYCQH